MEDCRFWAENNEISPRCALRRSFFPHRSMRLNRCPDPFAHPRDKSPNTEQKIESDDFETKIAGNFE